jgi:SAM-dependent methyltransferase
VDDDESPTFWANFSKDDLVVRVAALHAQRRESAERLGAAEIHGARSAVAQIYLSGAGIEVGAGDRPFPLPEGAHCYYGDVRDRAELVTYFGNERILVTGHIDAQTMAGIVSDSLDFVISAHVIEHLYDPIGSIRATVKTLKPDGVFVVVVPEMRQTWDRMRPPTCLEHVLADSRDGGQSTRLQAYIEHVKYVHPTITGEHFPDDEIEVRARAAMEAGMDLHVHAWRACDFLEILEFVSESVGITLEARISVVNENIYVLRRSHSTQ